jgi:hypothetical protein
VPLVIETDWTVTTMGMLESVFLTTICVASQQLMRSPFREDGGMIANAITDSILATEQANRAIICESF